MLTVSNYHYIRPQYITKYPYFMLVFTPTDLKPIIIIIKRWICLNPVDLLNNSKQLLDSKAHLITFDGLKNSLISHLCGWIRNTCSFLLILVFSKKKS
jgi:hypothetical protein